MPERIKHIIALVKLSDRERYIFVTMIAVLVLGWVASKLWDQSREIEKEAYVRLKTELNEERAEIRELKTELKACYRENNDLRKGRLDKFDTIIQSNHKIINTLK